MQKDGGQRYQEDTLGQERQNQGKLTMKVETVMTTNQKHLVTGKESELLEATTAIKKIVMGYSKDTPFSLYAAIAWQRDRS